MSDLAPQETTRSGNPVRCKVADVVSLAFVLAAVVKLCVKGIVFDAVDLSITLLGIVAGIEMVWRYRGYIPRVIVFVILPRRMAASGHNTKWPLR